MTVGLGCMRLSTDADRDVERARATLEAAWGAGVRTFDTARAYGHGDDDLGHNERLLAALPSDARNVTKGGMRRPRGGWRPDGRAKTIRADAEASAEALGRPADIWLLHAPDPRVPFGTSLRAMAKVLEDGTAKAVGLSNVRRDELAAALESLPIAAVQVALSPSNDEALRGGVVELARARGVEVIAHSPFGGPKKAYAVGKDRALRAIAERLETSGSGEVTPHQVALAWLSSLGATPIPGARRPETAAACHSIVLDDEARAALSVRFGASRWASPRTPPTETSGEVVLVMGIPSAGKTRSAQVYVERGHARLNRDERGGTLKQIAAALDDALGDGARDAVLDNTYRSRAQRTDVIEVAWRHGRAARCVFVATPEDVAQVRLVGRMIDELGAVPEPDALRRTSRPGVMPPTSHSRMARELEPPGLDEGFASIEVIEAERREPRPPRAFVRTVDAKLEGAAPTLLLGWEPGVKPEALAARQLALPENVTLAICPHGAGAPVCWCRPPLPGLVVAWLRGNAIDPRDVAFVGGGATFARMAAALGASHLV